MSFCAEELVLTTPGGMPKGGENWEDHDDPRFSRAPAFDISSCRSASCWLWLNSGSSCSYCRFRLSVSGRRRQQRVYAERHEDKFQLLVGRFAGWIHAFDNGSDLDSA